MFSKLVKLSVSVTWRKRRAST